MKKKSFLMTAEKFFLKIMIDVSLIGKCGKGREFNFPAFFVPFRY